MFVLVVFFVFFHTISGRFVPVEETNCGYKSCHALKDGVINVHLVPHTHDDVGWLKTLDQYYYGSATKYQYAGVQYILDSVFEELKKDPNKRFIYVETAFFWKWWIEQDDVRKHQMKKLVNNGQLEFIGGAWSMNDEATTNYQSTIDQFTWGLRKLNDTFGECGRPKIGWQIDPFGHSKEMASIFAQLGFDGVFLGRIDYQDKSRRFKEQEAEMIWKADPSLGESSDIFTGVLYNTYSPPPGLCFDIFCEDDPIIDDKNSPDYNVDSRVDDFFAYLDNVTKVYTTKNVLITMGDDFQYQNAHVWYKNLDKLIKYGNARNDSKYHLLYSTPSCYLKAVYDESQNKQWPVKEDDFFPYASDPNSYWTGYFTSRPTIKRFEREGNNFLQVCKQLATLSDLDNEIDLGALREAMGVMQHHDAITGTEKQHVANDYARILSDGIEKCKQLTNEALNKLITNKKSEIQFEHCLLTNISSCPISEDNDNFTILIYNPLSSRNSIVVRLPVSGENYVVKEHGVDDELPVQLTPIPEQIVKIPGGKSKATIELSFVAVAIPPLGFKAYSIKKIAGNKVLSGSNKKEIGFDFLGVKLSNSGLLSEVTIGNTTTTIEQNFAYYNGFVGNNRISANRSSGAYIFRPTGQSTKITNPQKFQVYDGKVIKEIHQTFNDYISQIIRFNSFEHFIEFQWLVGPLPDSDKNGIEVVSEFQSNLKNSVFFTDSNGRQILNRTLSERPTWKLNLSEPIAGNYYPITSRIGIVDETKDIRMTILTDRSQGGSSLRPGQLELMVHRKCIHDDAFGVGEALNETAYNKSLVVRGSHYLMLGPALHKETATGMYQSDLERMMAQRNLLAPWVFLLTTDEIIEEYQGLTHDLPLNVQVLTLEPWKEGSILLRLEHIIEKNNFTDLAVPVIVDLEAIFHQFKIISIQETTLGANQWLKDNEKLDFNRDDSKDKRSAIITAPSDFQILLNPMQIRTFIVKIDRN